MRKLFRTALERFSYKARFLGSAAAVVGIAAGLNSLFGGGGQPPSPGNFIYANPAQQGQASQTWMDALNRAIPASTGLSSLVTPSLMSTLGAGLNVPTTGLAGLPPQLQAAYSQLGSTDQLYANLLGGAGAQALSTLPQAGISTYLNALDPQQKLHDFLMQQTLEQSGAGQAQRGIQMGGVGQGLSDDAARMFEMDWQNQLLGRQISGLTALERSMAGGSQIGSGDFGASASLMGQVPGALTAGAAAPQSAFGIQSNYLSSLLNSLGGGLQTYGINPLFQLQNQIIPFLNQGAGAGASAFGGALQGYGMQSQNQAAGVEGLMTGLTQLGNSPKLGSWLNSMWGSGTGGGGGTTLDPATIA